MTTGYAFLLGFYCGASVACTFTIMRYDPDPPPFKSEFARAVCWILLGASWPYFALRLVFR